MVKRDSWIPVLITLATWIVTDEKIRMCACWQLSVQYGTVFSFGAQHRTPATLYGLHPTWLQISSGQRTRQAQTPRNLCKAGFWMTLSRKRSGTQSLNKKISQKHGPGSLTWLFTQLCVSRAARYCKDTTKTLTSCWGQQGRELEKTTRKSVKLINLLCLSLA